MSGISLSQAIQKHAECFPPLHIKLVQSAESSGTLAHVLYEVAHLAHWENRLTSRFREIATQPVITILAALAVLLSLMRFYICEFATSIGDILEAPLPAFTSVLFGLSELVTQLWVPVVVVYLIVVLVVCWLFTERQTPRRLVNSLLRTFPSSRKAVTHLDAARISGVWAQMQQKQAPLPEILSVCCQMVEDHTLQENLESMRQRCERGGRNSVRYLN